MTDKKETDGENKRRASGLNMLAAETLSLLKKIVGQKGTLTVDVLLFWEQIVGEELSTYTFPEKIVFKNKERANGVLYVGVANGAYALELQHRENFVLDKVNAFFGYQAVCSMRIRQTISAPITKKYQFNQPFFKKKLVSKEEQNYIEQMTTGLENTDLQKQLQSLGEWVFSESCENKQE